MAYSVKELFITLQGEGAHTGRRALFCRFAGCNLWSGREQDRLQAICRFCDTDFVGVDGPGGGKFAHAEALAQRASQLWGAELAHRYIVCTGGEPLLQLDAALIEALHAQGFTIAIETNGTIAVPQGIDWVCMSPKANAPLVVTKGDELKLVFPQQGGEPERYTALDFTHFYLQPMDGQNRDENTQAAIQYCLNNPRWQLSLQTHKLLGLP
jgi:7-carboxy-7-deazaguanine synthase